MRQKTLHIERTTDFVSKVVIYKKVNRPLETQVVSDSTSCY